LPPGPHHRRKPSKSNLRGTAVAAIQCQSVLGDSLGFGGCAAYGTVLAVVSRVSPRRGRCDFRKAVLHGHVTFARLAYTTSMMRLFRANGGAARVPGFVRAPPIGAIEADAHARAVHDDPVPILTGASGTVLSPRQPPRPLPPSGWWRARGRGTVTIRFAHDFEEARGACGHRWHVGKSASVLKLRRLSDSRSSRLGVCRRCRRRVALGVE